MDETSRSIRPEAVHATYRHLQQQDVARLFCARADWPARACPLCAAHAAEVFVQRAHDHYVRCAQCRLVYLAPAPPADQLAAYFGRSASASFFHEHVLMASAGFRKQQVFAPRLALLRSLLGDGAWRVLDVGCAVGSFLDLAAADGLVACGVEPNEAAARCVQAAGHAVVPTLAHAGQQWAGACDAVTAWEVFAHLDAPGAAVRAMAALLRPGGVLVFTTPNVEALEYRLLRDRHPNLAFPFLQLFATSTVTQLLQSAGLVVEHLETPGRMDLHTIAEVLAPTDRLLWPDALVALLYGTSPQDLALREAVQQALISAGESGHMLGVARRPV